MTPVTAAAAGSPDTGTTIPGHTDRPTRADTAGSGVVHRFFAADDFDFAAKCLLGHAGQGLMDVGLALATIDRIADGDAAGWYQAWLATAGSLRQEATGSQAAGHDRSANAFFLAASAAYDQALSFVDGMSDDSVLLPTFRLHRECWDAFITTSGGRHLPVEVPYEGSTMPGYLLRPDASGAARPTVVVTNGSDGALTGMWAAIAKGALDRGWNVCVFDGPGQQSMLFERDIPFRHDWEAVLTPVVDTLVARGDVDENALLAYGISQGGYWLPRALAFEHRFVGAVADGGAVDVARAWTSELPPTLLALLKAGNKAAFDHYMSGPSDPATARRYAFRARPYGRFSSAFDLFTEVNQYQLGDLVDQITTPFLITDPEDEQFFPGQPQELYDALSCPKVLIPFTEEQGAAGHCEPMARGLVDLRMGDFYTDCLAGHFR